ncbi:MAG TPA: UDP-N-acetylmuramoyl-L-alanine--D-glutamate ligase [Actinomycetota bacterium]|nr:UDP-N-acetylmuramoyl-L-alanine--D-glutamate ligase [Actinomycetota bacterium]
MSSFTGQRWIVVGLGVSGHAAARALLESGAEVYVTEASRNEEIEARADLLRAAGARVETGGHDLDAISASEYACVSPGVPPQSDIGRALHDAGVDVIGEVELAWRLGSCDFLAVTGTNGKTTTTALLAGMLEASGVPSVAAGNIGLPLVEAVRSIPAGGAIAVEVSSFQLATIRDFRPRVAVILNVAEDHTDWHGSFDAYARAKARLVMNQRSEDFCVANLDDDIAIGIARGGQARVVGFSAVRSVPQGACVEEGWITWRQRPLLPAGDVRLAGGAGIEDVLAAASAALSYGVGPNVVSRAIRSFEPLPHRMEVVGRIDGVTYIDDSKATNPHAALGAVRGLRDVVLIAGGRAKGIDLSPLRAAVPPVQGVVAIGEASNLVRTLFEGIVPVVQAGSMEDAVTRARDMARPGGSVLLSPGCASLDMYENYAARGMHFARLVRELDGTEGRSHSHA